MAITAAGDDMQAISVGAPWNMGDRRCSRTSEQITESKDLSANGRTAAEACTRNAFGRRNTRSALPLRSVNTIEATGEVIQETPVTRAELQGGPHTGGNVIDDGGEA